MRFALRNTTHGAPSPWPKPIRALVLLVGVALSAVGGYVMALAVVILAVAVDAAPLLAGDSTPQQPWVTPVAVVAGMIVFGFGVVLSARTVRRHPSAS